MRVVFHIFINLLIAFGKHVRLGWNNVSVLRIEQNVMGYQVKKL